MWLFDCLESSHGLPDWMNWMCIESRKLRQNTTIYSLAFVSICSRLSRFSFRATDQYQCIYIIKTRLICTHIRIHHAFYFRFFFFFGKPNIFQFSRKLHGHNYSIESPLFVAPIAMASARKKLSAIEWRDYYLSASLYLKICLMPAFSGGFYSAKHHTPPSSFFIIIISSRILKMLQKVM